MTARLSEPVVGAIAGQIALPPDRTALWLAAFVGLGFLALVVAMILLSRRQLRRDVREIVRAAEEIRSGGPNRRADVGPESPLAHLAVAVNRLADASIEGADRDRAEERLRAVLDAARDRAVVTVDADLEIRSFSAGGTELFGWDEEEIEGRPAAELFVESSWKDVLPALTRRAVRERGVETRVRGRRKDGSEFPGQLVARAFPGRTGELLFLLRDLSLESRLEAELRESEERYRALFEGLAEGVFLLQRGSVVLANPAFAALCGVAPADLAGRPLRDWIATRDLLVVQERLAALEGGLAPRPTELAFTLLDGEGRRAGEVRLRATAVVLAGRPAVLGVVRDETAERQVEAELRRNESHLDAVLEATSDGILLLADGAAGGVVRMTNAAFGRLLRLEPRRVLGATEVDLLRLLRERGGGGEALAAFLASATRGPRVERITLDGEPPRLLEVRASALTGPTGDQLGRVLAVRDITDQRAFEETLEANAEALRKSKAELESSYARLQEVKEDLAARAREEERLNRELKALDEMKTNLLANVSHELQTPLVSIRGYTEMILRERLGSINEEQRRGLTLTLTNIDRLISMIDNLLFFTRKQDAEGELKLAVFPLRSVVDEAVALVRESAEARRVELGAQHDVPGLEVQADRDKVLQVFLNLLTNAVKFNREGGRVEIATRPGKPGFVEVRVRDTGVGIAKEDLDRIFDRYYRGDSADRSGAEGYGIGLALVRNILRMHGCRILAESEVGKGSTFFFSLPVAGEGSPRRATEPAAREAPRPAARESAPAPGPPPRARFRIIRSQPDAKR